MNTVCNKATCIRGYKFALDAKVQLYILLYKLVVLQLRLRLRLQLVK